jgi:type II secretory pathway component PulJ
MTRTLSIQDSESGFGIISVLVATVLLAVAVIALSSSSAFLTSMQTDASERSTAASIGIAYMEEVKTRAPAGLASESPVRVNEAGEADAAGAFVRWLTVSIEPSVPDAVRAVVEVEYPAGLGRTRTTEFVTVIYRGNQE